MSPPYHILIERDVGSVPSLYLGMNQERQTLVRSSNQETHAVNSLGTRTDIIIKKANKESALVVMSCEEYVTKVMQHLNNKEQLKVT